MKGFEIWVGTLLTIYLIIYSLKTCYDIAEDDETDEYSDSSIDKEMLAKSIRHLYC